MAYYLVSARAKPEKLGELAGRLAADAFLHLEPFGRALFKGLRGARIDGDRVVWEERTTARRRLRRSARQSWMTTSMPSASNA